MSLKRPCIRCGLPARGNLCVDCGGTTSANKYSTKSAHARGYGRDWQKVRLVILDRDGWRCYICKKELRGLDATVDHIQPISLRPELRLDPSNLAACCRSCNASKQDLSIE